MKYNVVVTQQAANDLSVIFEYIAVALLEKEIAVNVLSLLQRNILSLAEMPGRFRLYENEPWKSRGLHVMPVKKYLVFYLINESRKEVQVIRILYGARDLDSALVSIEDS